MVVRQLSVKRLKVWQKNGMLLLLLLAAVPLWQGCSDDPVTPRKSIIGNWELITLKFDGEEMDFEYDDILVFDADSTGYENIYLEGDLVNAQEYESWEANGDSLSIKFGLETRSFWYSCTDDRLTLRGNFEEIGKPVEWIYTRMEDL